MWNVGRYVVVVLQMAIAVSGATVRVPRLGNQEFSNHSVVPLERFVGIEQSTALECRVSNNPDCCWSGTAGHWYRPNGDKVSSNPGGLIYRTRGGQDEEWAAVYLHWKLAYTPAAVQSVGLFRCEIPASGARGDIQTIYVGVYHESEPTEGRPNVTDLVFHLDTVSTDPFQSGPPVFTLTCNSSGGPATDVTWKLNNDSLSEDSDHVMTRTLVDQLGPDYSSTLTVTGRKVGSYSCNVSNTKGHSVMSLRVKAADHPVNLTAVQVNATAVMVSWTAPSSGPTPSGYRIYYQAEGDQMFTTVEIEQDDTEYLLTCLQPASTYNVNIMTLSQSLPSTTTALNFMTLDGPTIVSAVVESPQSVRITWRQQSGVERYEIGFEHTTGSEQLQCPQFQPNGTKSVSPTSGEGIAEYTLTDLEENSVYTISLTAVGLCDGLDILWPNYTVNITTWPAAPTGAPAVNAVALGNSTAIHVQWDEVECSERNSEIAGYRLWYSQAEGAVNRTLNISAETMNYTISGLRPFTNYSIELAAVNTDSQVGPKATTVVETHQGKPGPVHSLKSISNLTSIELTWSAPLLPNGIITAYEVSHQLQGGMELERVNTTGVSTTHTLTGLRHQTTYTVTVRAYTIAGSGEKRSVTTQLYITNFQLKLGPVTQCTTWSIEKTEEMKTAISSSIYNVISARDKWDPQKSTLQNGLFSCWNSPSEVTYRSTIVSTQNQNHSRLLGYVENWVRSERPFIQVRDFRIRVYQDCPVQISSMNDPECLNPELPSGSPSVIASSDPVVINCLNWCLIRIKGEPVCVPP